VVCPFLTINLVLHSRADHGLTLHYLEGEFYMTFSAKPLFRLRCGGIEFSPSLWPTVGVALLLPLFIHLGFWQLHRAALKHVWLTQFHQAQQTSAVDFLKVPMEPASNYRPVKVRGYFDNQHVFLQDNIVLDHNPGYYVWIPFVIPGLSQRLLVNVGWIAAPSREKLPIIIEINNKQTIEGLLYWPMGKGLILKNIPERGWPRRIPQLDTEKMAQDLQQPLYPGVLLLSPNNNHGYKKEWHPTFIPPARHMGYAIQWFALAVTLVIIYFFLNLHRK